AYLTRYFSVALASTGLGALVARRSLMRRNAQSSTLFDVKRETTRRRRSRRLIVTYPRGMKHKPSISNRTRLCGCRNEFRLARRWATMENLNQRLGDLADKSRHLADAGRDTAGEAARLFRDLLRERPILTISALAAASYLIARFGSVRMLGTVAEVGEQASELADRAGGV